MTINKNNKEITANSTELTEKEKELFEYIINKNKCSEILNGAIESFENFFTIEEDVSQDSKDIDSSFIHSFVVLFKNILWLDVGIEKRNAVI